MSGASGFTRSTMAGSGRPTHRLLQKEAVEGMDEETRLELEAKRTEAIEKAWDAASRNKWMNFGYWAAVESHLRSILRIPDSKGGPFREIRLLAQRRQANLAEAAAEESALAMELEAHPPEPEQREGGG